MKTQLHQLQLCAEGRGSSVSASALLDELANFFPLIDQMDETPQDPEWHAEGNVRVHTEMVVDEMRKLLESGEGRGLSNDEQLILLLGAALHDIGKPLTTREEVIGDKPRIISPRHPARGRSYLAPEMPLLDLDWEICDAVLALVGYHHDPGKLIMRGKGRRGFVRLRRAVGFRLVYLLELADLRGRRHEGDEAAQREGFDMMELFKETARGYELWERDADPYREWKTELASQTSEPDQLRYVLRKGIRDFENGEIHTPGEALARAWKWKEKYPEMTLVCGPSGAGKSNWISHSNLPEGCEVIGLDDIREEITGRPDDQRRNGEVLQTARERLRAFLREKRAIVWDATNIRRDLRSQVIGLAHSYGAFSRIVTFPCPQEQAKRQNKKRRRQVAEKVIENQYKRMQWPEVWEADELTQVR